MAFQASALRGRVAVSGWRYASAPRACTSASSRAPSSPGKSRTGAESLLCTSSRSLCRRLISPTIWSRSKGFMLGTNARRARRALDGNSPAAPRVDGCALYSRGMNALPLILFFLAVASLGYRYYSAFLAAHVAALDDSRVTPAHRFTDGNNYVPTNKWVLFGHHFAAISGAGPLIGPVLAAQFGYLP